MTGDYKKFPKLREDLKISKMVNKHNTHYVFKDPIKNSYFRFGEDEYHIIKLFNGKRKLTDIVRDYNETSEFVEIDIEAVEEYWDSLNSMHLLDKSKEEMNVMLVEKVKEMRQMQLLSKKGSLMYKRFPLVDPDKFFDRVIPKISFLWSKSFLIFSLLVMLSGIIIILSNWSKFNAGIYELFSYGDMSISHMIVLWFVIYGTIAIHELGHGLTCKYYGGEVHEIGFLLLFFQPCLYANVNDAWLFDKKWKQIMVTIAGGYIEFFIGSLAAFVWVLTNPNTFINVISFQVMTIASVSTILFNFNPLMKLDGYYLLSDFLEAPNLKEESLKFMKHVTKKYIFRMPVEKFYATKREKKVYLCYGVGTTIWMTLLLTGLVGMAKGLLVEQFHSVGILITFWVAYKIFGGYVKSSSKFLLSFYIQYRAFFQKSQIKYTMFGSVICLIAFLFIPIHYQIKGHCNLVASKTQVIRAIVSGEVSKFYINDGGEVKNNDPILKMKNISINYNRKIASIAYNKSLRKLRKTIIKNPQKIFEAQKEVNSKKLELSKQNNEYESLELVYKNPILSQNILSCENQERIIGTFVKKGEEVCRVYDIKTMKSLIEVSEQDVVFLRVGQEVNFKLISNPHNTYEGHISSIRPTGKGDPKNPTNKIYTAEIELKNDGKLLPGMAGISKIYGNEVSVLNYLYTKLSTALRLDLFF